jgi:hypothetical protein
MSCIRIGSRTNERIIKKKDAGRKKKNTKENGGRANEKILPLKLIFSSYHGVAQNMTACGGKILLSLFP